MRSNDMTPKRRALRCTLLWAAGANATLLSSSSLEACVQPGASIDMACNRRLVVTLSVQNNQNASESISAASVTSATDSAGNVYDLEETLDIYLAKSTIELRYPLTYLGNFNNKPYEIVRYKDLGGRWFSLTNPCKDGTDEDGACGWMLDPQGNRIQNSNGFCCRCDFMHPAESSARGNLQCDFSHILEPDYTQSGHCLRMDPLWYTAFSIGAHSVYYTIDVIFHRCSTVAGANSSVPRSCTYDVARLSPVNHGFCKDFGRYDATTGTLLPSNVSACDAWVSLEGDFAAFEAAPDYSSRLLFMPFLCQDSSKCLNRTLDSSDRWMLIEQYKTTTGSECDKIGVSYSAFNSQGSKCDIPFGSCLGNQLEDYYQSDLALERQGRVGSYFTKFHKQGGDFIPVIRNDGASMRFVTNRFQKSIVTLMLNADSVKFVQRVCIATIVNASVATFEAMSRSGRLSVTITNSANIRGLVTVIVECSDGIEAVNTQEVTLDSVGTPGATKSLSFLLYTSSMAAQLYSCAISLENSLFRVTDVRVVGFNTTATEIHTGEQGGSPAPGNPSSGALA